MARPVPAKGFYTFNDVKYGKFMGWTEPVRPMRFPSIVYCSGTTKGNYYHDLSHGTVPWHFLTWTCVPSVSNAEAYYDYSETNPTEFPLPE